MHVFIVVAFSYLGLSHGRPQYNYNPPQNPSFNAGISSGGFVGNGGSISAVGSEGISGGGSFQTGNSVGGNGLIGTSGPGFITGGSGNFNNGFVTGAVGTISGGTSGGFVNGGSPGGFIGGGSGGTIVQKHIYVHVAPPEPEEFRQQQHITTGQAVKNYKIIFIKAPSPPTPTAAQIALQAQNQEKTLIYVLVKRPDELQDITIPSVAPLPPSKPEVYFIRYKTQKQTSSAGTGTGGFVPAPGTGGLITGGGGSLSSGLIGTGASGGSLGLSTGTGLSGGLISGVNQIGTGISGSSGGSFVSGGGISTSYGTPSQSGPY